MNSPIPLMVGPNPDEAHPAPIPMPWDRGGEFVPLMVAGTYGTHTRTLRLEYTIPPGKIGIIMAAYIQVEAPTTSGYAYGAILITNPRGQDVYFLHHLKTNSTTPLHMVVSPIPVFFIIPENWKIRLYTLNVSSDSLYINVGVALYIFNKLIG